MELFSTIWFIALFKIIMINIVLSGDNAIVIALASRNLPEHLKKLAIFWGTIGAIIIRVMLAIIIIWLLKIPFLQVLGGLLLLWIAFSLLVEEEGNSENNIHSGKSLSSAIETIIIADLVMSLDNVLAIAAAAKGQILLIVIGLVISVPIMIFGSQLVMKLMDRYPIIIQIGVAILAWTAGEMILSDLILQEWLGNLLHKVEWILPFSLMLIILTIGNMKRKQIHSM